MPDQRSDDVLALNELLAALDEAGASIDLGFNGGPLRSQLQAIGTELTNRVERSLQGSLSDALASDRVNAPASYRTLIEEWLAGAELSELLESRRAVASGDGGYRSRMTLGLLYPAMVAVLACAGLAATCWWLLPIFESIYTDLREPVGTAVGWLQAARNTAPLWLVLFPAAVVLGVLWLRTGNAMRITNGGRLRGPTPRLRLGRASDDAATLIDAGMERGTAIHLAGLTPASAGAAPSDRDQTPPPPLLAWAAGAGSPNDLRAIGDFYTDLARRGSRRATLYVPLIACVLLAGGATLLYGLALFVPVVELLWTLAF